ncbi:MAG TPA: hypothetical protein VJI32_05815 [Candidatus Nanoarchaeia archaeon]|nr:hypothetical protein [Candidatus Woesearchaeota archaeon]HIG93196.1 hypothetical protein [Candidatus Woesearchaeota archaeon]HIH13060.1 hypothetical protein [Candidatus Woesearchaeota archaeon]HLC71500.1 hypothetical protein [Candidatus Nanoarchaeia archaeon]
MGSAEKVLYDIQFIIITLLDHLQKKNQQDVLLRGDIKLIKDKLYELYSFDYRFHEKMLDIVDGDIHPRDSRSISAEFRVYQHSLRKAAALCIDGYNRGILSVPSRQNGWLYTGIKNRKKHINNIGGRIYLNCQVESIPQVISHIIDCMELELKAPMQCASCRQRAQPYEILCSRCNKYLPRTYPVVIKFIDSDELPASEMMEVLRPEKVVLYIFPWPIVLKNILGWLQEIRHLFHAQVPLFTQKMMDGVGYAPEPTAKQKERYRSDSGDRKTTSFGNLLCFLIAKVICTWSSEEKRIPTQKEILTLSNWVYQEIFLKKYRIEFELGMKE